MNDQFLSIAKVLDDLESLDCHLEKKAFLALLRFQERFSSVHFEWKHTTQEWYRDVDFLHERGINDPERTKKFIDSMLKERIDRLVTILGKKKELGTLASEFLSLIELDEKNQPIAEKNMDEDDVETFQESREIEGFRGLVFFF